MLNEYAFNFKIIKAECCMLEIAKSNLLIDLEMNYSRTP